LKPLVFVEAAGRGGSSWSSWESSWSSWKALVLVAAMSIFVVEGVGY
jgi:hypothetical protein